MRKRNLPAIRALRPGANDSLLNLEAALHLIPHVGGSLATYLGTVRVERANLRRQRALSGGHGLGRR